MTQLLSSANPQALYRYSVTATDLDEGLVAEAGLLEHALHEFCATCTEYATGVTPTLAAGLRSYARRTSVTDRWVAQVGQAFESADRLGVRWGYELAVEAASTYDAPIADAVDWLFGQAQQASAVVKTGVTHAIGTVQSVASTAQSYGQQALDWVTGAAVWTQDWWLRFEAQMSQRMAEVFTAIKVGWTVGWPMFKSYAATAGKQVVNFLWGMVWGEAWFPDVPGAGAVTFIGDVIAGIFVVGDIRDMVKYWFVRPFTSDDPGWYNATMGGASLVGMIPLAGDILKIMGKAGLKEALQQALQEAAEKAAREGLEDVSEEALQAAAAKALAESVQRITATVGDETAKKLLQDLTPQAAEALIKEIDDPALVKHLAGGFTGQEIQGLVARLGSDPLKKIGTHLTPTELQAFIAKLGDAKVKELAEKYGGDVMKYYGPDFFSDFKGVTNDTMNHLLRNDGISGGQLKGAHDHALFMSELVTKGRGQIINTIPYPTNPDVVKYQYKVYKRLTDGSLELDAAGKPILSSVTAEKTVINDLAINANQWRSLAEDAVELAILNKRLAPSGGKFSETVSGLTISGYLRDGEVTTFFIEW